MMHQIWNNFVNQTYPANQLGITNTKAVLKPSTEDNWKLSPKVGQITTNVANLLS